MNISEERKWQVYNEWLSLVKHNPGKAIQMSMEEAAIVNEMRKRGNTKAKRDTELEKRAADIRERYGKHGVISDSIFDY